jgi:hypothetical protein
MFGIFLLSVASSTAATIEYNFETPANISGETTNIVYTAPDVNTFSGVTVSDLELDEKGEAEQWGRIALTKVDNTVEAAVADRADAHDIWFDVTVDDAYSASFSTMNFDTSFRVGSIKDGASCDWTFSTVISGVTNQLTSGTVTTGKNAYNTANSGDVDLGVSNLIGGTSVRFLWSFNGTKANTWANLAMGLDDVVLTGTSESSEGKPSAYDQAITMFPNTSTNLTLTGFDPEGSNLTYAVESQPINGTLVTNGALPNLTYTATNTAPFVDSFTFTVNDGETNSSPATISITVTNQAPVATGQTLILFPDTPTEITLVGSDGDNGPSNLTYIVDVQPTNGTLSGATNVWTYTPTSSSFQGVDSFTFHVFDGFTTSTVATVELTVTNQVPVATPQSLTTVYETPIEITLAGTDGDSGPSNLTYAVATDPTHGDLVGAANVWTYTPDDGYLGVDTFTFTVNDGLATSDPVTVSINVTNEVPVADDQSLLIAANSNVVITLTGSDTDNGPSSLTYIVGTPANGDLVGASNVLTYTPNPDFAGTDSFTFTVTDGVATSAVATVSIAVSAGTFGEILYTFETSNNISGATSNIVYTAPDVNTLPHVKVSDLTLEDRDITEYSRIVNIGGSSVEAAVGGGGKTISFTIPLDEAVRLDLSEISFDTSARWTVNATLDDVFVDFYTVVGGVTNNMSSHDWKHDGDPDYQQSTNNTVQLQDMIGLTDTTVTFNWELSGDRNNTFAIIAYALDNIQLVGAVSTTGLPGSDDQDLTTFPNCSTNITLSGWDPEDMELTYAIASQPSNGTVVVNGELPNVTYTPDVDFSGVDSFTFTVNNGTTNSSPGIITITVTNQVPVATVQSVSVFPSTPLEITLAGTDADSGPSNLTYLVASQPSNGTLVTNVALPKLIYTPNDGYTGADSFTFIVNDGMTNSSTATVSITVINQIPVADGQTGLQMLPGTALEITLTASDADNGPSDLTYSVSQPSNGSVTTNGALPDVIYTPEVGFTGTDSFTFTVFDGLSNSLPATVEILVTNALPVATAQSVVTTTNTPVVITLAGTDPEGSSLTYSVGLVTNGTLEGATNVWTYTPNNGYTGADGFTFTVNDGLSNSAPATVSITVVGASTTVLAGYDFSGVHASTSAATVESPNVTATVFQGGTGIGFDTNTGVITNFGDNTSLDVDGFLFGSADQPGCFRENRTSAGNVADYAGAVSGNKYLTFTVTPDSGYALNLDSLTFKAALVTAGNSLEFYALNTSVDGFTTSNVVAQSTITTVNAASGEYESVSIDLSGSQFQNITEATEFRLYIWGANGVSSSSATSYDKVVLNGAVSVVSAEQPVISASVSSGSLTMSWEGGGTYNVLTNANLLNAAGWGVATNGTSPIAIEIGGDSELFYKLSD